MNNQHPSIETPGQLMRRYAYQFNPDTLRYQFFKGWFDITVKLCSDIDAVLKSDHHGFQWVQFKEKFGTARFQYRMGFSDVEPEERTPEQVRVLNEIFQIVTAAKAESAHRCIVCGAPGTLNREGGYLLTLCSFHSRSRQMNLKPDPFTMPRDDIEGER